jgi:predicted phosphodiesterase
VHERLLVVSDIHGNAAALGAIIRAAERTAYDRLLVLGDLLTYGTEGNRVLDLLEQASASAPVTYILGNHDALYQAAHTGAASEYFDSLPSWLQESIENTARTTDIGRLNRLPFQHELILGGVLFAHANPYGPANWAYLNSLAEQSAAAAIMRSRALWFGMFGHTHRAALSIHRPPRASLTKAPSLRDFVAARSGATTIFTVGSAGQSRGAGQGAAYAVLELNDQVVRVANYVVPYDVQRVREGVQRAGLSVETRERLLRFYA